MEDKVKDVFFSKEDEQALQKRKDKRKDGMVYAHQNGKSQFYQLDELYLVSCDKSVGQVINELLKFQTDQLEKNEKIKKALKHVLQENKKIKEGLKKYGMVD